MGKFLIFCRIQLKFCSWLYKKRWHTSWKFQLEKTSNKKVIDKKPLTNLYEMNSSSLSTLVGLLVNVRSRRNTTEIMLKRRYTLAQRTYKHTCSIGWQWTISYYIVNASLDFLDESSFLEEKQQHFTYV